MMNTRKEAKKEEENMEGYQMVALKLSTKNTSNKSYLWK